MFRWILRFGIFPSWLRLPLTNVTPIPKCQISFWVANNLLAWCIYTGVFQRSLACSSNKSDSTAKTQLISKPSVLLKDSLWNAVLCFQPSSSRLRTVLENVIASVCFHIIHTTECIGEWTGDKGRGGFLQYSDWWGPLALRSGHWRCCFVCSENISLNCHRTLWWMQLRIADGYAVKNYRRGI